MFRYILFDLDGTLTDPSEGIINSILHALGKLSIEERDVAALKSFIGPPLYKSFMQRYAMTYEQAEAAVGYYREYFSVKGLYENAVYGGIEQTLARLISEGRKLILATSKPLVFARKILEHFNLLQYFCFISGATLNNDRVEKEDIISYALESLNILREHALMVGDRKFDVAGAKLNGIASLGVIYGFGDRAELEFAGADAIAETPEQIPLCISSLEK